MNISPHLKIDEVKRFIWIVDGIITERTAVHKN